MLTLEQKRQVREGGLDCLPPLISSHLAGQPWVALVGTARAKAGQVQGVRVQASRGGRWPQRKGLSDRLPQEVGWHSPVISNDQGRFLGGVKSQEVLTWVVPSEGHHFASWRKPIALDKVGRDGPLRRESKCVL